MHCLSASKRSPARRRNSPSSYRPASAWRSRKAPPRCGSPCSSARPPSVSSMPSSTKPVARLTSTDRSRRRWARTPPSCWRRRHRSNASTCSAPSCPAEDPHESHDKAGGECSLRTDFGAVRGRFRTAGRLQSIWSEVKFDLRKVNHMNQTGTSQKSDASVTRVAMNLEVDVIPVSDVERSKQFYQLLGWRLDEDVCPAKNVRIVQFTPPGSGCSVTFGNGLTAAAPGSATGALIVSDIEAAHDELIRRGIDASEMWHGARFAPEARLSGPDPKRTSYGSFFSFNDPDGNTWLVQEVTTRLPGRIDPTPTAFASSADLESALRRAEAAHGEHDKRNGQRDANWPDLYAA